MTSTTAGSPTCNCKNPDTCIHSFRLKLKDETYEYKQNNFYSNLSVIDGTEGAIPLELTLTGKSCVAHNPECPNGVIYDVDRKDTVKKFNSGTVKYDINYKSETANKLSDLHPIYFMENYILSQKDVLNWLPKNQYILRVAQCYGDPLTDKQITFKNGIKQILNLAPHDRLWTIIDVYPDYKWEVEVTVGVKPEVQEASDKELQAQRRKENKSEGKAQRDTRGWTKLSRFSLTDSLKIKGKLSYTLNQKTNDFSQELEADFSKKAKELSVLQGVVKGINAITGGLSENKKGEKHQILSAEIKFPELSIKGGGELTEDDKTHELYMQGSVAVGFTPFIGIEIKLDLLQAFAAWYGMAEFTSIVRAQMEKGKDLVDNGDNGAYLGIKFDLIMSGTFNLALTFESNVAREWEWKVDKGNEFKAALTLEANARAGVKFYIFHGVFEVYGKAIAEGMIGIDPTENNDGVDFVFYHNGVKLEVGVSVEGGVSNHDEKTSEGHDRRQSTETTTKSSEKIGAKKEWIIHEKLEKEKSTYRCHLS
ncbi:hypothetical protein QEA29_004520 [Salmonella enterica]|nr:hypothetical protein [Salmonella enterica]EJI6516230.1 hypothetical protein [Salmonella enterica]EJI6776213.1 hypothetical protein [Salmonella enterica]EJK2460281.1 hypothetical protein [Salmonella enterica]EKT1261552.1 hypothetical protein [Salmonella enterica]